MAFSPFLFSINFTMTENEVTYKTRTTGQTNPISLILQATFISLSLLFILIFLNLTHPLLLLVVFLLSCFWFIAIKINNSTFTLKEKEIVEKSESFITTFGKNKVDNYYKMADLKSYSIRTDYSRSLQEKRIFEAHFIAPVNKLILFNCLKNDSNIEQFEKFAAAFESKVERINESREETILNTYESKTPNSFRIENENLGNSRMRQKIVKQKVFYETIWAKILSIICLAGIIAFFYFSINANFSASTLFKFYALFLPGSIYLIYRSFWRNRE